MSREITENECPYRRVKTTSNGRRMAVTEGFEPRPATFLHRRRGCLCRRPRCGAAREEESGREDQRGSSHARGGGPGIRRYAHEAHCPPPEDARQESGQLRPRASNNPSNAFWPALPPPRVGAIRASQTKSSVRSLGHVCRRLRRVLTESWQVGWTAVHHHRGVLSPSGLQPCAAAESCGSVLRRVPHLAGVG